MELDESSSILLQEHLKTVYSVAILGDLVFTGSHDSDIVVWTQAEDSWKPKKKLKGHTWSVFCLSTWKKESSQLSYSKLLFSGSGDHTIKAKIIQYYLRSRFGMLNRLKR